MKRTLLLVLAALVLLPCQVAGAYVYWSDGAAAGAVGRADLGGAPSPGDQWVPGLASGCGVAVDGSHLYWTTRAGTIGRAGLDGSGADEGFIVLLSGWACGVAVDSGHLYWASNSSGKLGRADLDGSNLQPSWMSPGKGHGCGIAVDATSVYWATDSGVYSLPIGGGPPTSISEATGDNCGVAVNAAHVYWASGEGYIERDPLSGGPPTPIVAAPLSPCGLAVDSGHVYWGNSASDTIGRANLDGSGVAQRFAEGARDPCGVAVDPLGSAAQQGAVEVPANPAEAFRLGRVTKNRKRGTARLEVLLPGPGTVQLAGRRIVDLTVTRKAPPAEAATPAGLTATGIAIRPTRGTRALLRAYGLAIVSLSVTYTPFGGAPKSRYTRVVLALRRGGGRAPYSSGCRSILSSCRWLQGKAASSWLGYLPSK